MRGVHLPAAMLLPIAAGGGLVFYGIVVRPIWNAIFSFASRPSEALAGTIAGEAEVLTPFDESGKGLVRLIVDGQIVRILATLETDEHTRAADIVPGEKLVVVDIDGQKNTCRVARL
jgi:hypothetical protein